MIPLISVDRTSKVPIHRQLYERVRDAILDGRLMPGTRVPATRELARQYGVARTTVMTAYDQLIADGYLESKIGAWTLVAERPPLPRRLREVRRSSPPRVELQVGAGAEWLVHHSLTQTVPTEAIHHFGRIVAPAVDCFPAQEWRQLVARRWREMTPDSLVDFDPDGDVELREAVRRHVHTARGIDCDLGQIIITTGSQQGVEIMAQIALEPGDRVALEDPSFISIQNALRVCGAVLDPAPLDEEGLRVDVLADGLRRGNGSTPKLVYTTPTHQLPTGVVLSASRRRRLIDWAASHRALIVEDDCDAELSYDRPPPEAMFTIDDHGVVVYLGNFTRVLNPSIQIGFMIVPTGLADTVRAAHRLIVRQTDIINQAALARFIRSGSFDRHLRRLRRVHMARRDCLVRCLRESFGDRIEIGSHGAGLHMCVRWPSRDVDAGLMARLRAAEISIVPVRPMYMSPIGRDPGVVLAYASLTEQQIEAGVRALSTALALS